MPQSAIVRVHAMDQLADAASRARRCRFRRRNTCSPPRWSPTGSTSAGISQSRCSKKTSPPSPLIDAVRSSHSTVSKGSGDVLGTEDGLDFEANLGHGRELPMVRRFGRRGPRLGGACLQFFHDLAPCWATDGHNGHPCRVLYICPILRRLRRRCHPPIFSRRRSRRRLETHILWGVLKSALPSTYCSAEDKHHNILCASPSLPGFRPRSMTLSAEAPKRCQKGLCEDPVSRRPGRPTAAEYAENSGFSGVFAISCRWTLGQSPAADSGKKIRPILCLARQLGKREKLRAPTPTRFRHRL